MILLIFLSIFLSTGLNAELSQKNKNNKHTSRSDLKELKRNFYKIKIENTIMINLKFYAAKIII